MANAQTTGKIYLDSTGLVTDARVKVSAIIFTPSAANDQLILRETETGANCVALQSATAKTTMHFDFSLTPIVFGNGLYVQTLSTGATATLITTSSGGG